MSVGDTDKCDYCEQYGDECRCDKEDDALEVQNE